jgi:hypothetical protein
LGNLFNRGPLLALASGPIAGAFGCLQVWIRISHRSATIVEQGGSIALQDLAPMNWPPRLVGATEKDKGTTLVAQRTRRY